MIVASVSTKPLLARCSRFFQRFLQLPLRFLGCLDLTMSMINHFPLIAIITHRQTHGWVRGGLKYTAMTLDTGEGQ